MRVSCFNNICAHQSEQQTKLTRFIQEIFKAAFVSPFHCFNALKGRVLEMKD